MTLSATRRNNLKALISATAFGTLFSRGLDAEPQPRMRAALNMLRNAKQALERAEPDKGGHRARALELVDQAIHEVEAGVRFDNRH